ncbi:MAG: hypothetical protein ABIE03_02455 [Patescibacteria group bacterium]
MITLPEYPIASVVSKPETPQNPKRPKFALYLSDVLAALFKMLGG